MGNNHIDYYNKGADFHNAKRYDESLTCYNEALKINPDFAKCLISRGLLLDDMGKKEEALQDYNKALEINPDYAICLHNRGILLKEMGKNEEALQNYNKALEINPDDADCLTNRGNLLSEMGKKKVSEEIQKGRRKDDGRLSIKEEEELVTIQVRFWGLFRQMQEKSRRMSYGEEIRKIINEMKGLVEELKVKGLISEEEIKQKEIGRVVGIIGNVHSEKALIEGGYGETKKMIKYVKEKEKTRKEGQKDFSE